jgi:hypothetical protein
MRHGSPCDGVTVNPVGQPQERSRVAVLGAALSVLHAAACGGGAIEAAADPSAPRARGHVLVLGRLSALGCPDHRSLIDRAMGAGDFRYLQLRHEGQPYRIDVKVDSEYFVAELPPGHYEVTEFHIQQAMGTSAWAPKGWTFEVLAGGPAYLGSIRFICLNWGTSGFRTEANVTTGVVQELEPARAAFQRAFPAAGAVIDRSAPFAGLAGLPRTSGFSHELYLRRHSTDEEAPRELWALVRDLVRNPLPPGAERTRNEAEYRIRHGAWEARYLLDEGARFIIVMGVHKSSSGASRGRFGGAE